MNKDFIIIIIRNTGFWHSGWLFALLQMLSMQNVKEFFWWPPLKSNVFSIDSPFNTMHFKNSLINRLVFKYELAM